MSESSLAPATDGTVSTGAREPFEIREARLSAAQHRVFFAIRASLLASFFVWLFFFKDGFTDQQRTWIAVALIGAVLINVIIARLMQQPRVILAVNNHQLTAAIAPHQYPQTLDLQQVTRIIAHRQYLMLERPGLAPVQLIFTGKYRPLQARLLSLITQEYTHIQLERMP